MTGAIVRSANETFLLVTFMYGENAATSALYTDLEQDIEGFTSTPTLQVELPDNTGAYVDKRARIVLPMDTFSGRISDGKEFSPTYVTIEQRIRGLVAGDASTNLILYKGRVEQAVRNYQRRRDRVSIECLTAKDRLDVPLGLQMNHHDEARLFGPLSGLTQAAFQQTGQIASIDGKEVTITTPRPSITNPTAPGGTNDRFWERGWLEKDGIRIGIFVWNRLDDPAVFVLRESPPADWLLAGTGSILFVPGTHCTIEDSREVWDDEEHFLGLGYASPDYNVIIENGLNLR